MELKVYSIRDSKGEIYHQPFFNKTNGEAVRNFTELVKDGKSMISKYPQDYDLYFLGHYDDQTGKLVAEPTPKHIVKAVDLSLNAQ